MSETFPKFQRYRVKRGDSLWRISEYAYGRGDLWPAISRANHLQRKKVLLIGLELTIPSGGQVDPKSTSPAKNHLTVLGQQTPPAHTAPKAPPPVPLANKAHDQDRKTKGGPFSRAKPVLFPQFKYELSGVISEFTTPVADYKLSWTGEITLQKEGVITGGLTFTKEGVEVEYKKEADGVLNGLFSKSNAKVENGKAEVSLAIGSVIKSGDQVLATTETSIVPPNGIKYTAKGREIKGTYEGFEFSGVLGYELEIKIKPQLPTQRPQEHTVRISHWAKVAGISLVVLAGVIIVVDVAKDVVTLGAGTVESPVSFAAASAAFGSGMAMVH